MKQTVGFSFLLNLGLQGKMKKNSFYLRAFQSGATSMPSTSEKYDLDCSSSVVRGIIKIIFFSWVGVEGILGFLYFLPVSNFDEFLHKSRDIPEETVPCWGD